MQRAIKVPPIKYTAEAFDIAVHKIWRAKQVNDPYAGKDGLVHAVHSRSLVRAYVVRLQTLRKHAYSNINFYHQQMKIFW